MCFGGVDEVDSSNRLIADSRLFFAASSRGPWFDVG
jgi:hypothetical protein